MPYVQQNENRLARGIGGTLAKFADWFVNAKQKKTAESLAAVQNAYKEAQETGNMNSLEQLAYNHPDWIKKFQEKSGLTLPLQKEPIYSGGDPLYPTMKGQEIGFRYNTPSSAIPGYDANVMARMINAAQTSQQSAALGDAMRAPGIASRLGPPLPEIQTQNLERDRVAGRAREWMGDKAAAAARERDWQNKLSQQKEARGLNAQELALRRRDVESAEKTRSAQVGLEAVRTFRKEKKSPPDLVNDMTFVSAVAAMAGGDVTKLMPDYLQADFKDPAWAKWGQLLVSQREQEQTIREIKVIQETLRRSMNAKGKPLPGQKDQVKNLQSELLQKMARFFQNAKQAEAFRTASPDQALGLAQTILDQISPEEPTQTSEDAKKPFKDWNK